jgi:predicted anti-sigma-YlaC factor YlaD
MSVVDLHPEDLLDKDARGELTGDERVRLDTHLARCSACRAETMLRADFAAELDEQDHASEIMSLVQGALAAPRPLAMKTAAAPKEAAPREAAPKEIAPKESLPELEAVAGLRRRPRRTAAILLVAAALLAAGAAGATGVTGRIWESLRGASLETTHTTAEGTTRTSPARASGATGASGAAAAALAMPPTVETSETAGATEESARASDALPVGLTAVAAPVAPPHVGAAGAASAPARAVGVASGITSTSTSTSTSTTAAGLFGAANGARREGDTVTALARYDALERQFPGTPEARVAKATAGKLLLDRGDAAGALARFDSYIASGSGELREEAMAGRATALEHLGRDDDEARAWAALLAAYPGTPYAAHARARIARSLPR